MNYSLVPEWIGLAWTAIYVVVLCLHISHMVTMPGRARLWHASHTLMAAGMIDMYWPGHMPVGAVAGEVVFAVALAVVLALISAELLRQAPVAGLWLIAAVDLAAMIFMFAAMAHPVGALTTALVIWFTIEALGWAFGYVRMSEPRLGEPLPDVDIAAPVEPTGGLAVAVRTDRPRTATRSDTLLRASLVLMSLGMAYMFLAMLVGASGTPMQPGMPGM